MGMLTAVSFCTHRVNTQIDTQIVPCVVVFSTTTSHSSWGFQVRLLVLIQCKGHYHEDDTFPFRRGFTFSCEGSKSNQYKSFLEMYVFEKETTTDKLLFVFESYVL